MASYRYHTSYRVGIGSRMDAAEHAEMADEHASAGEGDELLVRPNSKIKVHKETRIRYNADAPEGEPTYKTRTRTYKPPRKMTA